MSEEEQIFPFPGMIGIDGRRQMIIQSKRDYIQESIPKIQTILLKH